MVDVDHVEMAAVALVEERAQEVEARRSSAVGDGRGGELGLALKLVHVFLVYLSGILGAEVGLAGVVGFVGSEEIFRSTLNRSIHIVDPVIVVKVPINAKGGDEWERVIQCHGTADGPLGAPIGAETDVLTAFIYISIYGLRGPIVEKTTL